MVLATPLARAGIVLVLTLAFAALMMVRLNVDEHGTASATGAVPSERRAPGSAAHERHEYRLLLGNPAAGSQR